MIGYEQAPASIFVLRKSGITSPQQLAGKTLGAAANDSTFKLFPIFAKFAGFDANAVTVKTIDPALREGLLVNGKSMPLLHRCSTRCCRSKPKE